MKTKHKFPTYLIGLFLLLTFSIPSSVKAQYDDVSLETFYDELSPYGVWIDDPQYGQVWRPDVDQDEFRPYYTNGHWEMTEYGNTWVSNYDWGWAPFHYGRWHHASRGGWVWVPGTDWGPAWVSWRSGGGYYGWAPMSPGININISIGSRIPDFFWVFVPQRSIYYSSYPRYDRQRNIGRIHNTIFINNTYAHNRSRYYSGPRAEDIRRVTHQNVTIHNVRNQRPGRTANNQGNRPQINRNSDQQSRTSQGNSTVNRQSPRPQRAGENSGVTNNGRSGNSVVKNPASQNASRQGNQGTSTSRSIQTNQGQRSGSNVRSSAGAATSRQAPSQTRQQSPQRQTNTSSRQAPAQTRQQSPQRQTNTSSRQAPAQTRQQSPQRQSTNSGRQVTSQGSRQQSSGQNRGSSQSSSRDQGRSSRSHK